MIQEEILGGVNIDPEFRSGGFSVEYNPELGVLLTDYGPTIKALGEITILGFGVSGWQNGDVSLAGEFKPITDLSEIDPDLRIIDRYGKGIGARLYNTPQATAGAKEQPREVGMYAFSVNPDRVRDLGKPEDSTALGRAKRVLRHNVLKAAGVVLGEERVIDWADQRHGDAEAVLYNQTPSGERLKAKTGKPGSVVPEKLMIIRRNDIRIRRVGHFTH